MVREELSVRAPVRIRHAISSVVLVRPPVPRACPNCDGLSFCLAEMIALRFIPGLAALVRWPEEELFVVVVVFVFVVFVVGLVFATGFAGSCSVGSAGGGGGGAACEGGRGGGGGGWTASSSGGKGGGVGAFTASSFFDTAVDFFPVFSAPLLLAVAAAPFPASRGFFVAAIAPSFFRWLL